MAYESRRPAGKKLTPAIAVIPTQDLHTDENKNQSSKPIL
jgi:hypothetical protein